jgi:hypothetical protein
LAFGCLGESERIVTSIALEIELFPAKIIKKGLIQKLSYPGGIEMTLEFEGFSKFEIQI